MKRVRYYLPLIFLVVLSTFASASQDMYEQYMSAGMSGLKDKNYNSAEEAFRSALKESPDDYKATLYLGVVLNKKGEKVAQSYLKKALLTDPQDPNTNLQLGIYYFNRSVYPEARDYFETTMELAPNSEYSSEANEYLQKMTQEKKTKPWHLDIAGGMQYDTNVILGPGNQPLPEGISEKSDWSGVLYLRGQYDFINAEDFQGTVSYSAYQSLHTRLSDFNVTQQAAGVDAAYEVTKKLTLKGRYSFEYVLVGGDEYDYAHTLSPSIVLNYSGFSLTFYYIYRNFNFKNAELFPDNSDRNGFNHSFGVTEIVPVGDFLDVRVGAAIDKDVTRKDFWAYRGGKVFGGLTWKPMQGLSADMYGEFYTRDYKGANPFSPTNDERNDHIQTYSLTITKALSDTFSVAAGELYIRNKSNINAFDYRRSITSLFITARF